MRGIKCSSVWVRVLIVAMFLVGFASLLLYNPAAAEQANSDRNIVVVDPEGNTVRDEARGRQEAVESGWLGRMPIRGQNPRIIVVPRGAESENPHSLHEASWGGAEAQVPVALSRDPRARDEALRASGYRRSVEVPNSACARGSRRVYEALVGERRDEETGTTQAVFQCLEIDLAGNVRFFSPNSDLVPNQLVSAGGQPNQTPVQRREREAAARAERERQDQEAAERARAQPNGNPAGDNPESPDSQGSTVVTGGENTTDRLTQLKDQCESAFNEARDSCQSPIEGGGNLLNFQTLLNMGGVAGQTLTGLANQGAMTAQAAGQSMRGQCEQAKNIGLALAGLNGAYGMMCGNKRTSCIDACRSYRQELERSATAEDRQARSGLMRQMAEGNGSATEINAQLGLARLNENLNRQNLRETDEFREANRWLNTCDSQYGYNVNRSSQQALQWGQQFAQASQCQDALQTASNCMLPANRNKPECSNSCDNPALAQTFTCRCQANPDFSPACPRGAQPIAAPTPFCQTPEGKKTTYCQCREPGAANSEMCKAMAQGPGNTGGGALDSMGGMSTPNSLSNDIAALTTPENNLGDGDGQATAVQALAAQARPGGLGMQGQFGMQGNGNNRPGAGGKPALPGSELDRGFRTQATGGAIGINYASQGGRGVAGGGWGSGSRDPASDKNPFNLKDFMGKDTMAMFSPARDNLGPDGITPANGLTIWQKISRRYSTEVIYNRYLP